MPAESPKSRPPHRPLTSEEVEFLTWLLKHGKPEATQYLSQISSLRVVSQCDCGCPTIDFSVGGKEAASGSGSDIIADFLGITPEGASVGVLVHVRDGLLSELEVYSLSDIKKFSFPRPETLYQPFGPSEKT
jgi:hypothetical protein